MAHKPVTPAIPEHTIIRYRARRADSWGQMVTPCRWRFFANAKHMNVMGYDDGTHHTREGLDWVNDWSCEELTEGGTWRINGRGEWPSPAALERALEGRDEGQGEPFFCTYEEALDHALAGLRRAHRIAVALVGKLEARIEALAAAEPPVLPP